MHTIHQLLHGIADTCGSLACMVLVNNARGRLRLCSAKPVGVAARDHANIGRDRFVAVCAVDDDVLEQCHAVCCVDLIEEDHHSALHRLVDGLIKESHDGLIRDSAVDVQGEELQVQRFCQELYKGGLATAGLTHQDNWQSILEPLLNAHELQQIIHCDDVVSRTTDFHLLLQHTASFHVQHKLHSFFVSDACPVLLKFEIIQIQGVLEILIHKVAQEVLGQAHDVATDDIPIFVLLERSDRVNTCLPRRHLIEALGVACDVNPPNTCILLFNGSPLRPFRHPP
mmetsp:Transcript_74134/g.176593  ORF Transcript_74134/g.176593 Transcript_74134/m.176593 type:complete len:284 (-) Transcript_74134:106-957(-)